MQNKDQCDKRRAHTSKPIFCTLLSHIKKPFNPLYLTMPAGLNPRELIHSDSVSEIFSKPNMATWFSHCPSFYTNSVSCPSPVDPLKFMGVNTFSLKEMCRRLLKEIPTQRSLGISLLPNHRDACTGTLKQVPCSGTSPGECTSTLPFGMRLLLHGKHRLRGNPARPGVPRQKPYSL